MLIYIQLLNFCQNTRRVFLGRNTPTPLTSEIMAQVDNTILRVQAVCRHKSSGEHVDWTPLVRKFANLNIQMPHFRGGFGLTPNEGSAILYLYCDTCALTIWFCSHGGALPDQQFADSWTPRQDSKLPPLKHGMHPFYRHFRNRILFSFRIIGVSNGSLSTFASACLWQS